MTMEKLTEAYAKAFDLSSTFSDEEGEEPNASAAITFSILDLRTGKTQDLYHKFSPKDLASEVWRVIREKYDREFRDTSTLRCDGVVLKLYQTLAMNGIDCGHHMLFITPKVGS